MSVPVAASVTSFPADIALSSMQFEVAQELLNFSGRHVQERGDILREVRARSPVGTQERTKRLGGLELGDGVHPSSFAIR